MLPWVASESLGLSAERLKRAHHSGRQPFAKLISAAKSVQPDANPVENICVVFSLVSYDNPLEGFGFYAFAALQVQHTPEQTLNPQSLILPAVCREWPLQLAIL